MERKRGRPWGNFQFFWSFNRPRLIKFKAGLYADETKITISWAYSPLRHDVEKGNKSEAVVRVILASVILVLKYPFCRPHEPKRRECDKNKNNLKIFRLLLTGIWRILERGFLWRHSSLVGNVRCTKIKGICCCCRRCAATSWHPSSATGWRTTSVSSTASTRSIGTCLWQTSVKHCIVCSKIFPT